MTRALLALALLASGCIDGDDADSCGVDRDCPRGRLCSGMHRCESPDNLFDLTAHWTFNSAAPTPASCEAFAAFMVGVSDDANGFAESAVCTAGVLEVPRVPTSMMSVRASGYTPAGDGSFAYAVSAEVVRAGATDVTLDLLLP